MSMENTGTGSVEIYVDLATGEGPTDIKTKAMYMPSAFCVNKAEPEKNTDAIKVENHMNRVTEEVSTSVETAEVHMPSAFCVKNGEPEHHLDSLKAERSLSTEACPTSYNNKVIALKVVDITNAEQVGSPAMKGEPQDTLREQESTGLGDRIYYYCKGCRVTFAARSELESHHCMHVVENKSTWTSQRNLYAGPSGEERNMHWGPKVKMWEEDAEAVRWGNRRRRRRMRAPNFEYVPFPDDVSQQIRFGSNRDATLMGDLEGSSPRHGEAAEGTQSSAANANTGQNCDAFQAQPVFKKLKSDSALDRESYCLKSKTEHQEHDDADHCFLQSLIPDMKKLSERRKRKFKQLIMSSMCTLLDEQEYETHPSNNVHRFKHPSAIDTLQQVMHLS